MKTILSMLLSLGLILSTITPSLAAEKQDKAAKRAAIMMQKMKQDMEAEKAALQAKFDAEKGQLSEALNQAQTLQHAQSSKLQGQLKQTQQLQADNSKLQQEKTALALQITQLEAQLTEKDGQLADMKQKLSLNQTNLETNEKQRRELLSKIITGQKTLEACEEKNAHLYSFGQDLVNLYDNASFSKRLSRSEPFFQLKRVELENILQAKHNEMLENKFDATTTENR